MAVQVDVVCEAHGTIQLRRACAELPLACGDYLCKFDVGGEVPL